MGIAALRGRVVVVTGASSGLGREVAVQFAAKGCAIVLAARREWALEETAEECRRRGAAVLTVVTDVTREEDVNELARKAIAFGSRIDVWVNNAGVTLFARLEQGPFELHKRVIETNLLGAMLCARAVVPVFRVQRSGTLINVGSILSKVGQPFVPSYVISKFGLRGLSEALRTELADEPGIHVCSVFPYAVDTPHFQAGANRIGRAAHAMAPVQSPEVVAEAIVELAVRPRRERHVPRYAAIGLALHALLPNSVERLLLDALRKWHFAPLDEEPTAGNLFEPSSEPAHVHGGRRPRVSTEELLVWAVGRFAAIQLDSAARWFSELAAAK